VYNVDLKQLKHVHQRSTELRVIDLWLFYGYVMCLSHIVSIEMSVDLTCDFDFIKARKCFGNIFFCWHLIYLLQNSKLFLRVWVLCGVPFLNFSV
jgi:hypothetical protein